MNISKQITMLISLVMCTAAMADVIEVKCNQGDSINAALASAVDGDEINISGTCIEAVMITTDGLTLNGNATIDGGGFQNAVTINGSQRIVINGLKIQNGLFGLLGTGGANFSLNDSRVNNNMVTGIHLEGQSSLDVKDSIVKENGVFGVNIDRASELKISGKFKSNNNGVFGMIFSTNSSGTFSNADVTVKNNILGIQVGIGSSLNVADKSTTVIVNDNQTTGLTIVSGSSLFVFEGTIIARNNQINHGVSANSNSNIDLDRGGSIIANNNGLDGIQLENSLLNMFNMPNLDASSVTTSQNGRHGISAFVESVIDLSGDSTITSRNNGNTGVIVDNGSSARIINSKIKNNQNSDIAVNFGSRADLKNNLNIGDIVCDNSALIRGDTGVVCPTN